MSTEEMETYYLKVIFGCSGCEGCVRRVTKVLQKIPGVHSISVEASQHKVTVIGNVNPDVLVEKLRKNGKKVSIWGAPSPNPQIEGGSRSKSTGLLGCLSCIRTSKGSSSSGGGGGGSGGNGGGVRSGGKNAHHDEIVEEEYDDGDD
ncbi:hypothetical protein L1987_70435 [Smallanthus sonchifolius]|uniref:Uncharacterized protein n=1 Tax=Smallanthus sonchifolius TaxID=185202 RepID=A0ACB9AQ76_9ASTR|nr:hypothetical protein L1987_70435 [Smallanthus sonchifolius]